MNQQGRAGGNRAFKIEKKKYLNKQHKKPETCHVQCLNDLSL